MPAIRPHKTATDTESSRDGPAEAAKAPAEAATLRYMHAWKSADGDTDVKSAYKFPHHEAGTDTPANIRGVNNALARLSQADIPADDDAGVKEHLNAHRKDAGLEDYVEEKDDTQAHHHVPIRAFRGNAQPYQAFWKFVDAAESDSGQTEMELYGVISEYSWFDDEISPKKFKQDLYKYGNGGPVLVKLDSPGGDVFAASAMRTIMMDYPGDITVRVDGLAASAAVIVAISGNAVKMMDAAYMMIHDPCVVAIFAMLDIETLGRLRSSLQSVKNGIVPAYAAKTGLSEAQISSMMTRETWMSAQEAHDYGFADEILAGGQGKRNSVHNFAYVNAVKNYENLPPELLNLYGNDPAVSKRESRSAADVERERRTARLRERLKTLS